MFIYSHVFNFFAKLIAFAAGIFLGFGIALLLNRAGYGPDQIRLALSPMWEMVFWLLLLGGGLLFSKFILYAKLLMPAMNWLFLAVFRRTILTWKDIRILSPLFLVDSSSHWLPVKELSTLPKEKRLAYLYELGHNTGRINVGA